MAGRLAAARTPPAGTAPVGERSMNFPRVWQFLSTLAAALCLANAAPLAPVQAATESLAGTTWRLVQFQGNSGQGLLQDEGSNYTVEFRADSTVAVQMDCHRGRGTWVSRSPSQLEVGPLALTRATCPRSSLNDQIAMQWPSVRSYALRDTHLFLSLTAGGGTYEFEPAKTVAEQSALAQSITPATPPITAPAQPITPATPPITAPTQPIRASWLDQSKPVSWNTPGAAVPSPPKMDRPVDPRCRALTRAPESEADRRLTDLGWDLIGGYQGGWGILVIQAAAGYDGMCRPQASQDFVFLRGVFVGTLSPGTMDARADAALNRVTLQGDRRLVAEYARYSAADALCCPSRTTSVVFEIGADPAVVRPVASSTSSNR
jgi:heat shock protein HslJ